MKRNLVFFDCAAIYTSVQAQLGERKTEDLKVTGSIMARSHVIPVRGISFAQNDYFFYFFF